jgi:hypothetical protein
LCVGCVGEESANAAWKGLIAHGLASKRTPLAC